MSSGGASSTPVRLPADVLWTFLSGAVLLLPSLLAVGTSLPMAVSLAAVVMVLTVAVTRRASSLVPVTVAAGPLHPRRDQASPFRAGRPTDPIHHPQRPRAPGRT
jgi:hypothetical protein